MPADSLVKRLFDVVLEAPATAAIESRTQSLTYRELWLAASSVAGQLTSAGIKQGDRVGLLMSRGTALAAAIVGTLQVGAAYVPLDPSYPSERLNYLIKDAALAVLLQEPGPGGANLDASRVVVQPERFPDDAAHHQLAPAAEVHSHQPAYVIYTSGSTGAPKGVVVSHGNVLSMLDAVRSELVLTSHDRWSLFHSPSFDFSVWEMWGAWLNAATCVVVPPDTARFTDEFLMFLAHERITVLSQIPSVFRNLVPFYEATPAMLPLRYVIFGGDRIDLPAVRRFRASYQSAVPAFVNMYGITETTVHATLKVLTEADIADDCSVIGRPLTSLEIEIVDERLHVVEDGSPGEILVAGDGVAAGYLGRPELTAERFVSVDLGRGTRRYYRSGDLGRRRDDGELEYLGRIDSQVKLRGFRIELGEIEAIAREVAGVRDAASTVLWREPGDGTLVLILVTAGDQPKSDLIEATRARFRADAPAHLAPHEIVISDSVPIAPSGKLDRQELPSLARRLTSR